MVAANASQPLETESCPCVTHCQQCSACGPLNEQGFCARCLKQLYRWVPACNTCHAEVGSFLDLSERGECSRCYVARMAGRAA